VRTARILVTGARTCTEAQKLIVVTALDAMAMALLLGFDELTIVHGKCKTGGVDLVAHVWAEQRPHATPEAHPADWQRYGRKAGMIRNAEMVESDALLCLGFPGRDSVGTWDCLRKAAKAGIPTHVYPLDVVEDK